MKVQLPREGFAAIQQLNDIKSNIIRRDLPQILKDEQKNGFPKEYDLIMTNKGRQSKRKLATLAPPFIDIGTQARPLKFEFIGGADWNKVAEAVRYATHEFLRRAPILSGKYINSLVLMSGSGIRLNGRDLSRATADFTPTNRIFMGPTVEYASVIEAGHFSGYYENALRGGIIAFVARLVRAKYGADVSCRMVYITLPGSTRVQPTLEFGVGGAFASVDKRPGKALRRRRTRR